MRVTPFGLVATLVVIGCASVSVPEFSPASATLLSRHKYDDYEKATFSFEHGVRDDPGSLITSNDWDIEFGNGLDWFEVTMVTDDCSRIIDLGDHRWPDMRVANLPILQPFSTPTREPAVPAVPGHMYLVHTKDSNSDLYALFRVERLVPGDSVDITWSLVRRLP